MDTQIRGLHHVTAMTSSAKKIIDSLQIYWAYG